MKNWFCSAWRNGVPSPLSLPPWLSSDPLPPLSSSPQAMWKPAYDFLLTWSSQMGDSYRDVIQELHTGLDKMKNPITRRWKHLTGTLILVNALDMLRAAAFSPQDHEDFAI